MRLSVFFLSPCDCDAFEYFINKENNTKTKPSYLIPISSPWFLPLSAVVFSPPPVTAGVDEPCPPGDDMIVTVGPDVLESLLGDDDGLDDGSPDDDDDIDAMLSVDWDGVVLDTVDGIVDIVTVDGKPGLWGLGKVMVRQNNWIKRKFRNTGLNNQEEYM